MMNDDKAAALFGTVSHDGGLWTLYLPREGSMCNITVQGYGPDTFNGFKGPVIRYDKADLEAVLKAVWGPPKAIEGWSWFSDRPMMTVEEYLQFHRDLGIPVEEWKGNDERGN